MDSNRKVFVFASIFVAGVIFFVWYLLFGADFLARLKVNTDANENTTVKQEETILLDISGIDDAYQAILEKSTRDFLGNHPVDEEFLNWFLGRYGEESLKVIAEYASNLDNDIWYQTTGNSIHVLWYQYLKDSGMQSDVSDHTYEKECANSSKILIDFTGDFSLAEGIATTDFYHANGDDITKCLDANLISEMTSADIMLINNEFVYSSRGTALAGKDYTFRGNPTACQSLLALGVDVVNLANNHVYDFGEIGLLDTIDTINFNGLPYIGAGRDLAEAEEAIYFIAGGKRIAIVSATQVERSTNFTKEATEDSAGVLKTLDSTKYAAVIRKAKKNADYVICYVHWGTEYKNARGNDQYLLANDFVEAGADAIIGAHSHCLQGADFIDGVPIYYSLGNFYFSLDENMPEDYDTAVAQIEISEDGTLQTRLLPCHFSKGYLSLVTDEDKKKQVLSDVASYSQGITFDDNGYLLAY